MIASHPVFTLFSDLAPRENSQFGLCKSQSVKVLIKVGILPGEGLKAGMQVSRERTEPLTGGEGFRTRL